MSPVTTLELIGTAEASRILGICRNAVNARVARGDLTPAGVVGPRKIRVFDRATIQALADTEAEKKKAKK